MNARHSPRPLVETEATPGLHFSASCDTIVRSDLACLAATLPDKKGFATRALLSRKGNAVFTAKALVAAAVLSCTLVATTHASDIYTTNFDTYNLGVVAGQDGWADTSNAGLPMPDIISDPTGGGHGKVLRLESNNANETTWSGCYRAVADLPTAGYPVFTVSWDQFRPSLGDNLWLMSSGDWWGIEWDQSAAFMPQQFSSDGEMPLSAGTWQTVRMDFDFTNKTLEAYLDGVSSGKHPFSSPYQHWRGLDFQLMGTAASGGYNGPNYIDNIRISAPACSAPPSAPSNLYVSGGRDTADLSWSDNSINETGFGVFTSSNGTTWYRSDPVGANVTTYHFNLTPYEGQWFRVNASNDCGSSGYSNVAALPIAPTNLRPTLTSQNSIDLNWDDNSSNEAFFIIQSSTDGVEWWSDDFVPANATTYHETGLWPDTDYWFRVQAINSSAASDFTDALHVRTRVSAAGTPYRLRFVVPPAGASPGEPLTLEPVVFVEDNHGTPVQGFSGTVQIALKDGHGTSGAQLSGVASVTAQDGVARFSGISVDRSGGSYILTASAPALGLQADSISFPIYAGRVYVSQTGSDGNGGTSWMDAKRTIQAGINAAAALGAGEVWVAGGAENATPGPVAPVWQYQERVTLASDVGVFAGFSGIETKRSQRSMLARSVVLDGANQGVVVTVPDGATGVAIDGFTIRNSGSVPEWPGNRAVSIGTGASAILSNETITSNWGTAAGGVRSDGTLVLLNSIVAGNNSNAGSAVYCSSGSSATLLNNTIVRNWGSALHFESGVPVFAGNNIIAFNDGGGIEQTGIEAAVLTNNDVYGNGGVQFSWSRTENYIGLADRTATSGNMCQEPLLSYRDEHLLEGSPCIDSGSDACTTPGETDRDGLPRTQGVLTNIGALETRATSALDLEREPPFGGNPGGVALGRQWPKTTPVSVIPSGGGAGIPFSGAVEFNMVPGGGPGRGTWPGEATSWTGSALGGTADFPPEPDAPGTYLVETRVGSASRQEFYDIDGPTRLIFTSGPLGGTAGSPLVPQPVLSVDATQFPVSISLSIRPGTGSPGAVLVGGELGGAQLGSWKPSGVTIDRAGNGYQLVAWLTTTPTSPADPGWFYRFVQPAISAPFNVVSTLGFEDCVLALRVAGGLVTATSTDVARLNVIDTGASAAIVDVQDAVSIARKVLGMPPPTRNPGEAAPDWSVGRWETEP